MDPDTALEEIRSDVDEIRTDIDNGELDLDDATDKAMRIADHFAALDGWISSGGFLPQGWAGGAPTGGRD